MSKPSNSLSNPFATNDAMLVIGGIVTVFAFLIVALIAYPILVNRPTPTPATVLTVTESSRMMDAGAAAIATTPEGKEAVLYGDWARGDKVSAYPTLVERQEGSAPKFEVREEDPATGGWALTYVFVGFTSLFVGVILYLLFSICGYYTFEKIIDRRQRRQRESERIVNAAISVSSGSDWN